MARKVSFRDVSLVVGHSRKVMGPWRQRRYNYFRQYMPQAMARRAADSFHISEDARYYIPELVAALKDVDFYIRETMSKRRVKRPEAIKLVWRFFGEQYQKRGYEIESWQDIYRRWINEKVSPPSGGQN